LIWFTTAEHVWLASPVTLLLLRLSKSNLARRPHDLTFGFGGSGATMRDTGHLPNFSFYL
jgi:hypothetical protein